MLQASVHLAAGPSSYSAAVAGKLHVSLSKSKMQSDPLAERIPKILHHVYLAGAAFLDPVNCSAGDLLHPIQRP